MIKQLKLSLRMLNYIVLKRIAEKRGFKFRASRNTVEIGEMEFLLEKIRSKKSKFKIILIVLLICSLIVIAISGILFIFQINLFDFVYDLIN